MKDNAKVTKKIVLKAIGQIIEDVVADAGPVTYEIDGVNVDLDDVMNYVNVTIEQLDAKAVNAKKAAAKKKAEEDALYVAVEGVLDENYKTIADIVNAIPEVVGDGDKAIEVTRPKVIARLNKIVKAEKAHKVQVKVENRKVMAYAVGPAPVEETNEDAE